MRNFTILLLIIASSCTFIRGSEEKLTFNTNPNGAKVIIDGKESGITPLSIKLSRCADHNVIFEKKGYEDHYMLLDRKWEAYSSVILFGPLTVIDETSCASYTFNAENFTIDLEK